MKSSVDEMDLAVEPVGAALRAQAGPLVFLTVIFLLNFVSRIILSPLLPTIERELRISHGQGGFLFFLISAGYLAGLLGSSLLASRATHRWTIVISGAGVGTSLLAIAAASGLWAIVAGLFALGLASGLYMPSAIATITSLIAQRHWGKAIAVHELAPNLAFFAGPFVAELFLRWSTWRMALVFLGAAALFVALIFHRFGRGGEFPGASAVSGSFGALLRTSAFWSMLLLLGLGVSATVGVYAMLPLYLVIERNVEPSWANTVLALSRSHGPVLGLLGGWASDRLGPKRTMVISLLFSGIATLLLGWVSIQWLSATVLIQPLLAVCFFPAAFAALATITPPSARNLSVGFTVPFGFMVGGGAVPTFIGVMGDAGSFALGFTATGFLIICGAAVACLLTLPAQTRSAR